MPNFFQALSAALASVLTKPSLPRLQFGGKGPVGGGAAAASAAARAAASAAARASASGSEPKTGSKYYGPTADERREATLAARYTPKVTLIPADIAASQRALLAGRLAGSPASKASLSGSEPKTGVQYYGPGVNPLAHPTYRDTYTGPISENTWPYLVTPSTPTPTTVAPGVDYSGGGDWYDWGGYGGGGGGGGSNQWYVDMLKWNI